MLRSAVKLLAILSLALQAKCDNENHVVKPINGKQGPEKLLVLIPGANVPTEHYLPTVAAIQESADMRLWVAIPNMPIKRCIILCPTIGMCSPLHSRVTSIIANATAAGYNGTHEAPDTFIAGHSLGGICAGRLAQAYVKPAYQAAIVMGSYAEATSGSGDEANFPVPLLTLGAELDGGLGRPAMIGVRLRASDTASKVPHGENATEWQLSQKPVLILPRLDHSSFCPGFQVPGDVFPAEASQSEAMAAIGASVGAFLELHTPQPAATQAAAYNLLAERLAYTRLLLAPLQAAYRYEAGANDISGNDKTAPLCPIAQKMMAGSAVESKVDVVSSVYKSDSHEFEHTRTKYAMEKNGRLALNVSGHNDYYSGISVGCLVPANDIACKMISADRIAQQLNVTGNTSPNCSAINEYVVHLASEILNQTEVGRNTLARYHARGRGIFFAPDFSPLGNIGPLFVKGKIKIQDSAKGITISSIAIKNSISSAIFPGVHYCKFVSPARVIDYMMIDSLKKTSGCLNK